MSNQLLRFARTSHLYFGLLIAPSLMFFSFTGALQMFNLHEQVQGSSYAPPSWLARMAQVHKNATTMLGHRPSPPPAAQTAAGDDAAGGRHEHDAGAAGAGAAVQASGQPVQPAAPKVPQTPKRLQHLPLKIFFEVVAFGLFWMSLTGIYMAYRYQHGVWNVTLWLGAGAVIPLVLLRF